MTLQGSCLM